MKHVIAISIKLLSVIVILEVGLQMLTALSFWQIIIISVTVALLSYAIGDMLILDNTNNLFATICDIGLSAAVIFMFNYWDSFGVITIINALICAFFLGFVEFGFHKYMTKVVYPSHKKEEECRPIQREDRLY